MKPEYLNYLLVLILGLFFPVSAFSYYLFQRVKHLKALTNDFALLGIGENNIVIQDLAKKYKRTYAPWNFLVHSILPFIITIIGACLLFLKIIPIEEPSSKAIIPALQYGFIGAYIFSIQLVYRRYTTLDLQPTVFTYCTLTLISGVAFNYTAFAAIEKLGIDNASTGIGAGIFAIVAFSLGYFPSLAIRWFNQIANAAMGNKQHRANSLPLSAIDGISQFHETRLKDEGIDNVQNLASVKIDELLLNTRFNLQQVLEWVDQAILNIYVDPGSIDSFRRGGVRNISDFQCLWAPYFEEFVKKDGHGGKVIPELPEGLSEARQMRALQLQSTPEYLDALYATTLEGPNMAYIQNYWKNLKRYTQELQSMAVADGKKKARSTVNKTQIDIFKKIGEHDSYDENRKMLGKIAKTSAPNFDVVISNNGENTEPPETLAGLAWWYWWLTKSDDNNRDFTSLARDYYEKAVDGAPTNPKFRYELAKFYTDQMEDYDNAQKHAEKAIELFKEEGKNEPRILSLAILALICMKSDKSEKQDIGKKSIIEAENIIENLDNGIDQMENLESLQKILKQLEEEFDNDNKQPPAEILEFLNKFKAMRNTNSNDEYNAYEMQSGSGNGNSPSS